MQMHLCLFHKQWGLFHFMSYTFFWVQVLLKLLQVFCKKSFLELMHLKKKHFSSIMASLHHLGRIFRPSRLLNTKWFVRNDNLEELWGMEIVTSHKPLDTCCCSLILIFKSSGRLLVSADAECDVCDVFLAYRQSLEKKNPVVNLRFHRALLMMAAALIKCNLQILFPPPDVLFACNYYYVFFLILNFLWWTKHVLLGLSICFN